MPQGQETTLASGPFLSPNPMAYTEICIDSKLLRTFKRHALNSYPREFAQVLWGKVEGECVDIHALMDVRVERQTTEAIDFEFDTTEEVPLMQKQGLYVVGTIHSHPDGLCQPSKDDLVGSRELSEELIMGICAIRRTPKRRFVSFGFFDKDGKVLELTVAD